MKGERPPWLCARGPGRQPGGTGRRPDAVSPPGCPQGSPVPGPPPSCPLCSVEVGCARGPSNPEASSNRSHHNDTAICLGGESHLWTGRPWCGTMSPTQTQTRRECGRVYHSPLWMPGQVLVFSNAYLPAGRKLAGVSADLRAGARGKTMPWCPPCVLSPLVCFRDLFAHPAPQGSPPPHCSWLQSAAQLKEERKGPEQLFKRGGGEEKAAGKDTA